MPDIQDKSDIITFVDKFYAKVQIDPVIGPTFAAVVKDNNWSPHLERMYSFWNTVLFRAEDYIGNPFSQHARLPIDAPHFERWIKLLSETIDENFVGEKAEEVKDRAVKMGTLFQKKLIDIRKNGDFKNIF